MEHIVHEAEDVDEGHDDEDGVVGDLPPLGESGGALLSRHGGIEDLVRVWTDDGALVPPVVHEGGRCGAQEKCTPGQDG